MLIHPTDFSMSQFINHTPMKSFQFLLITFGLFILFTAFSAFHPAPSPGSYDCHARRLLSNETVVASKTYRNSDGRRVTKTKYYKLIYLWNTGERVLFEVDRYGNKTGKRFSAGDRLTRGLSFDYRHDRSYKRNILPSGYDATVVSPSYKPHIIYCDPWRIRVY